jgi:hypothetical protein
MKLWIVAVCCLIAGFLLGVCLDAKYRPNTITLFLQDNGKLSVQPKVGDLISWVSYDNRYQPQINFLFNQSPCAKGSTPSACWYDPTNTTAPISLYGCSLNGTPSVCADPGVGPRSGTGIELSGIVIIDFERLFGQWPELSPGRLMALGVSASSSTNAPQSPIASPAPSTAKVVQTIQVGVGCDVKKNVPVVLNPVSGNTIEPIPAGVGDTISWDAYAPYTITGLQICTNNTIQSGANQNCIIEDSTAANTYAYTLNVPSCTSATSGTFHIQVP